jgi:hypothetical protein
MYCRAVHNWYESDGNRAGVAQTSIGSLGIVAGSIAAPLSTGNAAKAWAGMSGAANAMQSTMRDNLAGSLSANRTRAVLQATREGQVTYAKARTSNDQVIAAFNMATECSMAPAAADSEALRAISGPAK